MTKARENAILRKFVSEITFREGKKVSVTVQQVREIVAIQEDLQAEQYLRKDGNCRDYFGIMQTRAIRKSQVMHARRNR